MSVVGVHSLVTGLNGHGKTLFIVADKLRRIVSQKLEHQTVDGGVRTVERRLLVSGVRELQLPHELVEVPEIDPERWVDIWRTCEREPGRPVVDEVCVVDDDEPGNKSRQVYVSAGMERGRTVIRREPVVRSLVNWWLWVEPGDVVFVDEAQRVYRPAASGRRLPMYLEKAETARHYGAQFIYATQSPNLIHTNLRGLIGPHEHVERMFGSSRTVVYQWPRINTALSIKLATKRIWKHDKGAFGLYKSAELHTKFAQRMPFAVWVLLGGLVAFALLGWRVVAGWQAKLNPAAVANTMTKDGKQPPGEAAKPLTGPNPGTPSALDVRPPREVEEPLGGRGLQWEGGYSVGQVRVEYFGLLIDGQRSATLTLRQLSAMGYTWVYRGPCSGLLHFAGLVRTVTCAPLVRPDAKPAAAPPPAPMV